MSDPGRDATVAVAPEVTEMSGVAALPRQNGELVFAAPWQGRAFGLALAVVRHLGVPWREFQTHLIAAITAEPGAPYYDCWVVALERLVLERRIATAGEIDELCRAVRDASPDGSLTRS